MFENLFRKYEKLVEITIEGKSFKVPDKNSLLRAFQYISPNTIPYGRFCWNQECQFCKVAYCVPKLGDNTPRPVLACKMLVADGMQITELSDELKWTLKDILKDEAESPVDRAEGSH